MKEKEIQSAIKTVCGKLWDLISMYEVTDGYNMVPNDAGQEIWSYLDVRFLDIRKEVNIQFLGQQNIVKKMNKIVDETECFIRSYEVPGVVTRWKQINPQILYFDCAFEIMENEPETYKLLCRGLSNISLACYPDEELTINRKEYFKSIEEKNNQYNLRYSEKRVFQNELLNTLIIIFESDFKEYFMG